MIRIAQATSSETFSNFGTPPNQRRTPGKLDGELEVRSFYASGWKAVFRAKDMDVRNKIAELAEKMVAHGEIYGYSQALTGPEARTGAFDAMFSMAHPDPAAVKYPVNVDCSSMASTCVYFAGVYEPALRNMNTTTEPEMLIATDQFVMLQDKELLESAAGCCRGDIYWRYGHTMICLDTDPVQQYDPVIICNCSACNMRTGPGTSNKKIKTLHPGDVVDKISTAENGWIQIRDGDVYGYVSGKYWKYMDKGLATGNVWMRDQPGYLINGKPKGKQIIVIPCNANVYLTGEILKAFPYTWYECIYAGRKGWASGMYIKEE